MFGASGGWLAHNKLVVEVRNTRMTTGLLLTFLFEGDKLTVFSDLTIPERNGLAGLPPAPVTFTLPEGEIHTKTKMYWEQ